MSAAGGMYTVPARSTAWAARGTRIALLLTLLAWLAMPLVARSAAAPGPTEVVQRLHSTLISVMSNARTLGYEGRYRQLRPVIQDTHDLPAIARVAAGRYWAEFSSEQRQQYVQAFSELSISTYARLFDSFSGETFKIASEGKPANGAAVVQAVLVDPGGARTRFDYVLRQSDGRWAIVNIVADGVSDLAIRRSEYAAILAKEGPDALIARLKARTAEHAGNIR